MLLLPLSLIPLFLYLIDASKEKNMKKGYQYITAFLILMGIGIFLLKILILLLIVYKSFFEINPNKKSNLN
jgi:hypothetical protein